MVSRPPALARVKARARADGTGRTPPRGAATLLPPRLTRRHGASLHHQIFLVLRDQILSGRYGPADLLPTEDELTRLFRVSRITVRTALAKLAASGLIKRRQGVGTFVKQSAPKPMRVGIREQRARLEQLGRTTTMKLVELDCGAVPADAQSWFGCEPGARFTRAVRLRAAARPVALYVTFIPEAIGRTFGRRDYARTPHHELIKRAGIRVTSAEQIITAGLAEPIVASRLKIEVGSPLLKLRTMFFDDKSRPVRYLEVLASPSMFELHMTFGPDEERLLVMRRRA
jgi:GntR family transcriptional regulator